MKSLDGSAGGSSRGPGGRRSGSLQGGGKGVEGEEDMDVDVDVEEGGISSEAVAGASAGKTSLPFTPVRMTFQGLKYSVPLPAVRGWCAWCMCGGGGCHFPRCAGRVATPAMKAAERAWRSLHGRHAVGAGDIINGPDPLPAYALLPSPPACPPARLQGFDSTGSNEAGDLHAGRLLLLKGISGSFRPGVLTALMGSSGAGKTVSGAGWGLQYAAAPACLRAGCTLYCWHDGKLARWRPAGRATCAPHKAPTAAPLPYPDVDGLPGTSQNRSGMLLGVLMTS